MKFTTPTLAALLITIFTPSAIGHSGPDHASSPESTAKTENARKSPGFGKPPHSTADAYKPDEILGWKLHVHEDLIANQKLHRQLMRELHHQLYLVEQSLPEDKVTLMKKVPVWIELENPFSSAAQYHPSKDWLSNNGYLPEKAKCVEISNAKGFVRRHAYHKANTMLHEFAHAFHDLHLGFNHTDVIAAFEKIKAAGTYHKVLHVDGKMKRHYALTDHKEYFAECTEAFFGANDHFPFVRPELKKADPEAHKLVKELWGVKEK